MDGGGMSVVHIVTTDWVMECVKAQSRIGEEEYHPRLLKPPTPPPQPAPRPSTAAPTTVLAPGQASRPLTATAQLHGEMLPGGLAAVVTQTGQPMLLSQGGMGVAPQNAQQAAFLSATSMPLYDNQGGVTAAQGRGASQFIQSQYPLRAQAAPGTATLHLQVREAIVLTRLLVRMPTGKSITAKEKSGKHFIELFLL